MGDELRATDEICVEVAANMEAEKLSGYSSAMQAIKGLDPFTGMQDVIAALSEAENIDRLSLVAGSLAGMIAKGSNGRF